MAKQRRLSGVALGLLVLSAAVGAQSPPPPPARYFTDGAGLVSAADAERLNAKLERFDRETSSQVLVVIYPELPSASLEDFTVRAAQAWRVGREKLDNGVVLFVFVKERKARFEVGYGLEGALPDALARRILDEKLAPSFAAGRYAEGLEAAVDAVLAATRGEYTAAEGERRGGGGGAGILILLAVFLPVIFLLARRLQHLPAAAYDVTGYETSPWEWDRYHQQRRRRREYGGWWGGGGWGGGGGGGGGFSGGGGSFGGGGATGSW